MIISSERREMCIISIEDALMNSMEKSRSLTESMLFSVTDAKPRSFAASFLSRSYGLPASAPAPNGIESVRSRQSSMRAVSRLSIS